MAASTSGSSTARTTPTRWTSCAIGTSARSASSPLREHGLGLDALATFVAREPLWKVHQAVFAVLALESEPVDPRL